MRGFFFLFLVILWALPALANEDAAYEYEYQVMDRCHDYFYVYRDHDSGCNHFFPSGWMGYISSISFDSNWTDNCHSGTSCIRISFRASEDNWAGIYWQEPENNWGTVPNAGYDLRGASKLTFWARGEKGGEEIEFFVGGISGPYPDSLKKVSTGYLTLSREWRKYTIDLSSKDLSYVIGGFGWVTNSRHNPEGATFYLDEIKFDKARPDDLRFLVSYETLPTKDPREPDRYLKNASFTYDNALALLTFLARGNPDDLRRARILAEAFVTAQDNDRFYTDGRLRNAYMCGDLLDHLTGKARLPGWWDQGARRWYEDEYQVSTYTGNMAWVIIALLHYYQKMGGEKYLEAAVKLGEWIERETRDGRCAGGYTGGYHGWEPSPRKLSWKSTEHNLDVYVAFELLYELTGEEKWHERALHARRFVEAMWDEAGGHFWTGTFEDGCTINASNIPLDVQAWGLMALGDHRAAPRWAEENCYTEADGFQGFDFNPDRDGIWFEGTAQMVVAYQIAGEEKKAALFLEELRRAQVSAPNSNGQALVAASHDGLSTGFDWEYFSRPHLGATAWYLFAERRYNPYWGKVTRALSPRADLRINGEDRFLTFSPERIIEISVSFDPAGRRGPGDYFLWAEIPGGACYCYLFPDKWQECPCEAPAPAYQGGLLYLSDLTVASVPSRGLPAGIYTLYFAVDDQMDGLLEPTAARDEASFRVVKYPWLLR